MDEIVGNREAINRPMEAQRSTQIDQDIRDKEIFAEKCAAVSAQKRKIVQCDVLPGPSGKVGTFDSEEDEPLAFAKSLFFKNKGKQGQCTSSPKSTPKNTPSRVERMERKQPERRPKQRQ